MGIPSKNFASYFETIFSLKDIELLPLSSSEG
jgi:hypothetical protein